MEYNLFKVCTTYVPSKYWDVAGLAEVRTHFTLQ